MKLSVVLGEQRVLVHLDLAAEHHRVIRVGEEGHRLLCLWARRVLEGEVTADESGALSTCQNMSVNPCQCDHYVAVCMSFSF
jgi:hypothetical protein